MLSLTLTFDGHRVRMVGAPERPEWVAKDACRVLQVHNTADALRNAGVTPAEKGVVRIDTLGGPQDVTTIVESGLWKLVLLSRKPSAQRFKAWLAEEVLPCIRQHGCYPAPSGGGLSLAVDLDDPRELRALVESLALRRIEDAKRLAVAEPKAAALDAIAEADGDMSLQDAARKMGLQPNKAIWQWEEDGLLFRGSHGTLTPSVLYSCSPSGNGVFRFVTTEAVEGRVYGQTKVTPKGLTWLAQRYAPAVQLRQFALAPAPQAIQ
jgi:prophage antirepressor-like protein